MILETDAKKIRLIIIKLREKKKENSSWTKNIHKTLQLNII